MKFISEGGFIEQVHKESNDYYCEWHEIEIVAFKEASDNAMNPSGWSESSSIFRSGWFIVPNLKVNITILDMLLGRIVIESACINIINFCNNSKSNEIHNNILYGVLLADEENINDFCSKGTHELH